MFTLCNKVFCLLAMVVVVALVRACRWVVDAAGLAGRATRGLILALSLVSPLAAAEPHWKVEHCADPQVTQLSQALACRWQAETPPRKGWGDAPRWMRVRLAGLPDAAQRELALELRPHFLGRIDLHQQGTDGQWHLRSAGSTLPGSQPFAVLGGYAFPLAAQTQEQMLYLQVKAVNIQTVGLEVKTHWQQDQAVRGLGRVDIGLQLGLLGMVALFALISFALNPQPVMGRFAVSSVNLLFCMLLGSGLLALTWLRNNPTLDQWLFDTLVYLRLSLWIWVSQALLNAYAPPAWYHRACLVLHAAVALAVVLNTVGFRTGGYALMMPAYVLTPVVLAWAAWRTEGAPAGFRPIMIGGFVLTGTLILLLIGLALLPPWAFDWARYTALLTDFANPLVMLLLVVLQQRSQLSQLQSVRDELMRTQLRSDFEGRLLNERQILIDMLVHELKNPLASIGLAVGSLFPSLQDHPPEKLRRVQNIRRSIHDMSNVLERCALMNALEQEQAVPADSQVDLAALVRSEAQATGEPARFGIDLVAASVRSDPHFLRLVISNLLENALKYSPPESVIRVELQLAAGVELRVINAVHPQMQPDADQIFSRYYRHPLAQQVRGTGLGLFLVREICQKMGARIQFENTAGQVQFTLELPR